MKDDNTPDSSTGTETLMDAVTAASPAGEPATPSVDAQAESSPAPDVEADSSPAEDVTAESSPAGEPTEPESLLDAAKASIDSKAEDDPETPEDSPPSQEHQEPAAEAAESEESDTDDGESTRFDKHPRFKELVRERNEFKQDAEQYRKVQGFLDQNELGAQDAADALGMAALFQNAMRGKTSPEEALKAIDGYRNQLLALTGDVLPEDLQQRVDNGDSDEQTVRELASERARSEAARREAVRQAEARQQREVVERQQRAQESVRTEIANWEQTVRSSDPDYEKKSRLIPGFVREIAMEKGAPKDAAEALAYVEQAYSDVTDYLKGITPTPRPTPPAPPSDHGVSAGDAEPSSIMEAAQQGLARSRQAMQ